MWRELGAQFRRYASLVIEELRPALHGAVKQKVQNNANKNGLIIKFAPHKKITLEFSLNSL